MALSGRAQRAINDYNEWLERVQRTVQYHNEAMNVFQRSVDELREVRAQLTSWRVVSDDPDFRRALEHEVDVVADAIPHIQRMIMPKLDFL